MFSLNSFSLSKLVKGQHLGHTNIDLCYFVYAISNSLVFHICYLTYLHNHSLGYTFMQVIHIFTFSCLLLTSCMLLLPAIYSHNECTLIVASPVQLWSSCSDLPFVPKVNVNCGTMILSVASRFVSVYISSRTVSTPFKKEGHQTYLLHHDEMCCIGFGSGAAGDNTDVG